MVASRLFAGVAGLSGVAKAEDLALNLRLLTTNSSNATGPQPTAAAPYKIDLRVPTELSVDIGNMTAASFVAQLAATTQWQTETKKGVFNTLKPSLEGLKEAEIQDVKAIHTARRRRLQGRALAAKKVSYDTAFSVVPDYSAGAPSYMLKLNASGDASMPLKDKLINELATLINDAVGDGRFTANVVLAAVKAAAADPTLAAALAAAGAPADALAKLTAADVKVSAPKVSDGYTGMAFTTKAGYKAGSAAAATTAAPSTSNAAAAGAAALVAALLMAF